MDKVVLSSELVNAIRNYLCTKTYNEVNAFITRMDNEISEFVKMVQEQKAKAQEAEKTETKDTKEPVKKK